MRPSKWTSEKEQALILLFPLQPNAIVAEAIGMGVTSIKGKARQLGLKKLPSKTVIERMENVARLFSTHSFSEISKMLGIGKSTIHRICRIMNLKRTGDEVGSIIAHKRTELLRRERIRNNYGFEPLSKVKIVNNRKRTIVRHKLKKLGYEVRPDCFTIYYTESVIRNEDLEKEARIYGLSFKPISVDTNNLNTT